MHVPFCAAALRLLRLCHLDGPPPPRRRLCRRLPARADERRTPAASGAAARSSSAGERPSQLPADDLVRLVTAIEHLRRRRGDGRVQPGGRHAGVARQPTRRRREPHLARRAVPRPACCSPASAGATPRTPSPGRRQHRRGRHRGASAWTSSTGATARTTTTGARPSRACSPSTPARPRERLCPHRSKPARRSGATRPATRTTTPRHAATSSPTRCSTAAGLAWYEISNWSRPGDESRHNLNYWLQGDYLGLGCAAHSHLGGRRWWNIRTPERYIGAVASGRRPVAGEERLPPAAASRSPRARRPHPRWGCCRGARRRLCPRRARRSATRPHRPARRGRLLANEVACRLRAPAARDEHARAQISGIASTRPQQASIGSGHVRLPVLCHRRR